MKNWAIKIMNVIILGASLPFIAGCNSGGGDSGGIAGLISSGSSSGASSGGASSGGSALAAVSTDVGGSIPTIVNPEPTTILLLGSGLLAAAYYRKHSTK